MVALDTYWKRRRVEPCENNSSSYLELHMRVKVGTFVRVFARLPTHQNDGIIEYCLVGPGNYDTWDSIYERLFKIYFEKVTDERELGLIALAELE